MPRQDVIQIIARLEADTREIKRKMTGVRQQFEKSADKAEDMGRRTRRQARSMAAGFNRVGMSLKTLFAGALTGIAAYKFMGFMRSVIEQTGAAEKRVGFTIILVHHFLKKSVFLFIGHGFSGDFPFSLLN